MSLAARTKHQVVTEFRCSEILTAARKLFSARGFQAVTIDEIAAEAGLAKATVYQYFPSKQDIYIAALRAGVDEMVKLIQARMGAAVGAWAKTEAFVRTRLEYLEQNREFFAIYHSEFGNLTHPATLNSEFQAIYRRQFEALLEVFQQGIASGEIAAVSPETLAITVYEATRGLCLHNTLGWSTASIEEQVASLMQILSTGVARESSL